MGTTTTTTMGKALFDQGFVQVRFMDTSAGHPGELRIKGFMPNESAVFTRYGTDLKSIEYLPNQYTGSHSTASTGRPGNFLATTLVYQVFAKMGQVITPDVWDLLDLDLVCRPDGYSATWWVLDQAVALGLVAAPLTPPPAPPLLPPVVDPPVPPLPPAPPAAPPVQPSTGLSTPEQRIDELWAWVGQQWPIVRPVAIQALRMFRKSVGRQ